jgi:lysosomal acid lipase/cholesteryl ester hydrolase
MGSNLISLWRRLTGLSDMISLNDARVYLVANAITWGVFVFMIFARVLLRSIEAVHDNWPTRLHWVSDALYFRFPVLQQVFSHETTRADIKSIAEISAACGVSSSEYRAVCDDGYVLVLHRYTLCSASAETSSPSSVSSNLDSSPTPGTDAYTEAAREPVLLIHGLLQDSDSFNCSGRDSIVCALLAAGHDVWCGNNRGTKYSSEHTTHPPSSEEYWNFSIDHLAEYDVPAMMNIVLETSGQKKLTLIGFSQGSAQSFAALSLYPELNSKISVFIALAPAVKTAAVGGFITHLAGSYPDFLTTAFGKLSFLPIVLGWQRLLSPFFLERVVSTSMLLLFGWDCQEISVERRLNLYQYVYSLSSVRCVAHWFHVLGQNSGTLCRYEPDRLSGKSTGTKAEEQESSDYDISLITCPVAIFSGQRDSIIDPSAIPSSVQQCVHVHVQEGYEHLDMIWADKAHKSIFPAVNEIVNKFSSVLPKTKIDSTRT